MKVMDLDQANTQKDNLKITLEARYAGLSSI